MIPAMLRATAEAAAILSFIAAVATWALIAGGIQ